MELACNQVVLADESGKCLRSVGGFGRGVFSRDLRVVRMHVVKVATAANALHDRVFTREVHLVPAHMRDLEARFVLEAQGTSRNEAEGLDSAVFFTFFENDLAADANAQHRIAGLHHRLDGFAESSAWTSRFHRDRGSPWHRRQ